METIASSIYTKELEAFDYKFIAKNQTQTNNISVYESKYIAGKPSYTNRESIAIHCLPIHGMTILCMTKLKCT